MKVYILNFAVIVLLGLAAEKYRTKKAVRMGCFIYIWLQLTVLAAVRWGIGYDYNQYYNTFYAISRASDWSSILDRREEIGFLLFNRGMSYITDNIIVYLFFYYGLLYGLLIGYIYRYSEVKWNSIAAYAAFDYFAISICFMRQSMAMVIGLYAIEMIKKRKWYWAVLLILAASLFHSSAIILFAALAFSYIDFTNRKVQIAAAVTAVVAYVGCDFFLEHILVGPFEKYKGYIGSYFMLKNHVFAVYFPIFIFVAVLILGKKLCQQDKDFKRVLGVLVLGTFLAVMTTRHYMIERMSLYLTVYNIRIAAQLLHSFRNEENGWNYRIATVCGVLVTISAFAFLIKIDRYGIRPYQFNKSYIQELPFVPDIEEDLSS